MPANIVYTPTKTDVTIREDRTVWGSANIISSAVGQKGVVRHQGNGNLGELQADGGILFIVGHGNAGKGIGAHGHEAIGAKALVAQLTAEGLPTSPRDTVTIHLYACATGSSVRTGYALWRRDPYAERFAKHLAAAGFNDYFVVGYAGFMNASGQHSFAYHYQNADRRNWQGNSKEDAPKLIFRVNAGGFAKVSNGEWNQCTEIRLHPMEKRASVVLNIRPA